MDLTEQLDNLSEQYYDTEGDAREEFVAALKQLHLSVIKDPALLAEFLQEAPRCCGGIYIPYMFWVELGKFLGGAENNEVLFEMLKEFAAGDFEEEEQRMMKPLIVIYFKHEKQFEVRKFMAQAVEKSHPKVKSYFRLLFNFIENNPTAARAYEQKFHLLKSYYPNFNLFELSLQELQEKLAG